MMLIEERAGNALWFVAAMVTFAAWQFGTWLAERGRWRRARERGLMLPEPRFLGGLADALAAFLLDLLPVVLGLLPILACAAWLMFSLLWIGVPLWAVHGPVMGTAGGLFVAASGCLVGCAVLVRLGERRRERRERERAVVLAQLQAGGDRATPHGGKPGAAVKG